MVQKYEEYYGRFEQLENVLYESSKQQNKIADRRALKNFEKSRDEMFP
jgi:hypothetical protein